MQDRPGGGLRENRVLRAGESRYPRQILYHILRWMSRQTQDFVLEWVTEGITVDNLKVEAWMKVHNAVPKGIKFLGHTFTAPASFRLRLAPVTPGIFAILVVGRSGDGVEYEPIYFGECDDFPRRVTRTHERYRDWLTETGGIENLYVAYYATPFLTEAQRREVKSSLIDHYHPVCNEKAGRHFRFGALLGIGR